MSNYDATTATIFAQLTPETVELFYQSYQDWLHQQQMIAGQMRIAALQQQIQENAAEAQCLQPSPIALATLARLQASGVTDLDILDSMLQRGDEWLDYTMQLLEYCERIGIIRDDYTHWCAHALEDAYDWIASISEDDLQTPAEPGENDASALAQESAPQRLETREETESVTEEQLLQKLMSEADEETVKMPAMRPAHKVLPPNDISLPPEMPLPPVGTDAAQPYPIPDVSSYTQGPHQPSMDIPDDAPSDDLPSTMTPPVAIIVPATHTNHESIDTDVVRPPTNGLLPSAEGTLTHTMPDEKCTPTIMQGREQQEEHPIPRKHGILTRFFAFLWSD